ncbi:MAG: hypothetical protein EZS28_022733 [Streblomastix strix]|uniref:Uncharacterized protein n=1 Tax=Streblomastix strix TaxID=222440 RepID=A0A5J4VGU4_9EUKA|nr:MAG: hypothetical protein EZS28_022733 [Streblomastix strix]
MAFAKRFTTLVTFGILHAILGLSQLAVIIFAIVVKLPKMELLAFLMFGISIIIATNLNLIETIHSLRKKKDGKSWFFFIQLFFSLFVVLYGVAFTIFLCFSKSAIFKYANNDGLDKLKKMTKLTCDDDNTFDCWNRLTSKTQIYMYYIVLVVIIAVAAMIAVVYLSLKIRRKRPAVGERQPLLASSSEQQNKPLTEEEKEELEWSSSSFVWAFAFGIGYLFVINAAVGFTDVPSYFKFYLGTDITICIMLVIMIVKALLFSGTICLTPKKKYLAFLLLVCLSIITLLFQVIFNGVSFAQQKDKIEKGTIILTNITDSFDKTKTFSEDDQVLFGKEFVKQYSKFEDALDTYLLLIVIFEFIWVGLKWIQAGDKNSTSLYDYLFRRKKVDSNNQSHSPEESQSYQQQDKERYQSDILLKAQPQVVKTDIIENKEKEQGYQSGEKEKEKVPQISQLKVNRKKTKGNKNQASKEGEEQDVVVGSGIGSINGGDQIDKNKKGDD